MAEPVDVVIYEPYVEPVPVPVPVPVPSIDIEEWERLKAEEAAALAAFEAKRLYLSL